MSKYATLEYWERRYEMDTDVFEWYGKYELFSSIIKEYMEPDNTILNIGCGTARFSADLYDDGFTDITNVDASPSCIEINQNRFKDKKDMSWQELDMAELPASWDGIYDAVVDKGGSDCVFVGDETPLEIVKVLREVTRVLKPNGVFVLISCCVPNNRMRYLIPEDGTNPYDWIVFQKQIPKKGLEGSKLDEDDPRRFLYIYICVKGQRGRDIAAKIEADRLQQQQEEEGAAAAAEQQRLMEIVSSKKKGKSNGKSSVSNRKSSVSNRKASASGRRASGKASPIVPSDD